MLFPPFFASSLAASFDSFSLSFLPVPLVLVGPCFLLYLEDKPQAQAELHEESLLKGVKCTNLVCFSQHTIGKLLHLVPSISMIATLPQDV